jgi:transposase
MVFGWRRFRNRREVGALAGLAPIPRRSGDAKRDAGISKAGNASPRAARDRRPGPSVLIALWHYMQAGQVPTGATMST